MELCTPLNPRVCIKYFMLVINRFLLAKCTFVGAGFSVEKQFHAFSEDLAYRQYNKIVVVREEKLTYMSILTGFCNFVEIQQTLINGFLHCQGTLHCIQSRAPRLFLRLLNTVTHTDNKLQLIENHCILFND